MKSSSRRTDSHNPSLEVEKALTPVAPAPHIHQNSGCMKGASPGLIKQMNMNASWQGHPHMIMKQ